MALYNLRAKPTKRFGVEFRSKLEAKWARWFDINKLDWDYADKHWYDFVVNGVKIEIKPATMQHLFQAMGRVPAGDSCLILTGEPSIVMGGISRNAFAFESWSNFTRDDPAGLISTIDLWQSLKNDVLIKNACKISGPYVCRYCGDNNLISFDGSVNVCNWCQQCKFINDSNYVDMYYSPQSLWFRLQSYNQFRLFYPFNCDQSMFDSEQWRNYKWEAK